MAVSSPIQAVYARGSGKASYRSMPYTCSHTTPYVMLPTMYRATVPERCNDGIRQTAIINLASMLGPSCTVCRTLVSGGKHYLLCVMKLLYGPGCCKLPGNNLLEVM